MSIPKGDPIGIDVYEHGASVWPDVSAIEQKQTNRTKTSEIGAYE